MVRKQGKDIQFMISTGLKRFISGIKRVIIYIIIKLI